MGRLYPVGIGATAFKPKGVPAMSPPAQMPAFEPFPIGTKSWPVPKPANDNIAPVPVGPRMPARLTPADFLGAIGQMSIISQVIEVGAAIGEQQAPAFFAKFGHQWYYSYCPNPGGFGPVQSSSLVYFPQGTSGPSPRVQRNACAGLQALPGGDDGVPDRGNIFGVSGAGFYRYSNVAQTRYTHIRSMKNCYFGMRNVQVLPAYRQATAGARKPPALPKKEEKEKKFIIRGPLRSALNFFTETGDVVDCLFKALPSGVRAKAYDFYDGRLGKGAKAMWAYDYFDSLDWLTFSTCAVENSVEDYVYGRLGRFTAEANRRRGNLAGLEVGPAL